MWRTDNGGRKWKPLLGIGTTLGSGMAFSFAKSGYVVVPAFRGVAGGYLMRTDDGGKTWAPRLTTQEPIRPSASRPATASTACSRAARRSYRRVRAHASLTIRTDRTKLRKPVRIRISGRLAPARVGNEEVAVSALITALEHQDRPRCGQRLVHDELERPPRDQRVRRAVERRRPAGRRRLDRAEGARPTLNAHVSA